MKSTTRWTRAAILKLGNVYFSDEEEGEEGNGETETGGSGGGNSSEGTGSAGSSSEDNEDDPEVLKRKLRNKTEEQDRQYRKLQQAEKERDELRAAQEESERAKRTELENAKADLEKANDLIETQKEQIRRLQIESAFIQLKDIEWHDPEDALSRVDLSEVEFDEKTGKVKDPKALKKAAKDLAEKKPYLVKPKTGAPAGTPQGKPTGRQPAPRGSGQGRSDDELRAKYRIQR